MDRTALCLYILLAAVAVLESHVRTVVTSSAMSSQTNVATASLASLVQPAVESVLGEVISVFIGSNKFAYVYPQ